MDLVTTNNDIELYNESMKLICHYIDNETEFYITHLNFKVMGDNTYSYSYPYFLLKIHILVFIKICLAYSINSNESNYLVIFVFGDSLVDAGNNNRLIHLAKYNVEPNGIDFPGGIPTGRYTNGQTAIDFVGQGLGFKNFIPPYNDPTTAGEVVLHGVNYASGSSGILDHSGYMFGDRFSMDEQVDNFAKTRQYIISSIGTIAASELFSKSLFSAGIGSNDFGLNYFTPFVSIVNQKLIPLDEFVDSMISKYRLQLTTLYELGGRKFVIQNIPPIGCVPFERALNKLWNGGSCVAPINNAAMLFNTRLKALALELNSNLVGSQFLYADIYYIAWDLINNYQTYGFENNDSACCRGLGPYGGLGLCRPTSEVCSDRSKYIFWDLAHPSEAVNLLVANRLLDGDPNDIYPINIRQLCNS
ncbi:GDSL esterase/lipase At4g16230-like isoform X1 [Papaver somniferum]|uniref:GDSL esterase/lipase At4g16230-like isoform X1 n=1 Tax=Papaver somniferum TaxID=3469 RepID=UPI000E6F9200|nr:GDSL esterase/lipase At4g16230-like isoform X1 [Papaver somniferum]